MTATTDTFDPQLLRELRAAPWRRVERTFLFVLTASIGAHLCFAAWVRAQPMPVAAEPGLEALDRFNAQATPLPPLHKIPKLSNYPSAAPKPAAPAPTPAQVHQKIGKAGMLGILRARGGDLTELTHAPAESLTAALENAGGRLDPAGDGPVKAKATQPGALASIDPLSTSGVKAVVLKNTAAAVPPPTALPVTIEGPSELDPKVLQKFIAARRGAVQSCYERAITKDPSLQGGKVVLRLSVGAGGRVSDLDVEEDTLGSDAVTSCMSRIMGRWVFPVSPASEVPVSVPFVFARAG